MLPTLSATLELYYDIYRLSISFNNFPMIFLSFYSKRKVSTSMQKSFALTLRKIFCNRYENLL